MRGEADGVSTAPSNLPVDLAGPTEDRWAEVQVPEGWEDVAAIARSVAADLEPLTDRIAAAVRADVDAYRTSPPVSGGGLRSSPPVPDDDFRASVTNNMRALLVGLAEDRLPTEDELEVRRQLGARRAQQGLAVEDVLTAYQVGYRELWLDVVAALPAEGAADTTRKLLLAATTVWGSVQQVSDAIAANHASTLRRLEARRIGARQRFVELLQLGDLGDPEVVRLARTLGFDPAGRFQLTVISGVDDDHQAIELQRRCDELAGHHAVVARGSLVIVVAQRGTATALGDLITEVTGGGASAAGTTVAAGAVRTGPVGARESLTDAELTLAVTEPGTSAAFTDVWLWATLTGSQHRLAEVLRTGTETSGSHPHLAAAVSAFADHGFSVSEAARSLSLHANTVKYRLDRWAELTGWDPRTFTGLVRSLAAIRLG